MIISRVDRNFSICILLISSSSDALLIACSLLFSDHFLIFLIFLDGGVLIPPILDIRYIFWLLRPTADITPTDFKTFMLIIKYDSSLTGTIIIRPALHSLLHSLDSRRAGLHGKGEVFCCLIRGCFQFFTLWRLKEIPYLLATPAILQILSVFPSLNKIYRPLVMLIAPAGDGMADLTPRHDYLPPFS
jgi:hypothetical protein